MDSKNYNDEVANLKYGEWLVATCSKEKIFRFRCGSVCHWSRGYKGNGTRKAWAKCYGSMRYPKTFRTMKLIEACELEEDVKVRFRGNKNLPSAWDDYYSRAEKNWKYQRKTQYK